MATRFSDSVRIGPFRFRISVPVTGRGAARASVTVRAGKHRRVTVSESIGGRHRRSG
jgi:hypothetical protein